MVLAGLLAIAIVLVNQSAFISQLPIEQHLRNLPPLPDEPETVYEVVGQIKAVNNDGSILIVTARGRRTVTYDQQTIIAAVTSQPATGLPPSALLQPGQLATEEQVLTSAVLQVGQLVKVAGLTNISGLAKFKAAKISIIN